MRIGVDQDFSLVEFDAFADSSLSIFLYYFARTTHREKGMQIIKLPESLKLAFAFPTPNLQPEHKQPIAPPTPGKTAGGKRRRATSA